MKIVDFKKPSITISKQEILEISKSRKYVLCYFDESVKDWTVTYDASEEELAYMGAYLQKLAFSET